MFSSDQPALSFEHLWFSCVFFCFVFSPISTRMFSVTGVPHFHQGLGEKLAVSRFPTHGLHQNMAFSCGRNSKETTRNTKELAKIRSSYIISFFLWYPLISFDFLWFPSVSVGFLWFGLGGFYGFPLVSKGETKEKKIQGKDKPIRA